MKIVDSPRPEDDQGYDLADLPLRYQECAACAAKPGAPVLCPACLHNRGVIDRLNGALELVTQQATRTTHDSEDALREVEMCILFFLGTLSVDGARQQLAPRTKLALAALEDTLRIENQEG